MKNLQPDARFDWNDVDIRVFSRICDFLSGFQQIFKLIYTGFTHLDKVRVALVFVDGLLSPEEPGSMHVEPPRRLVPLDEITKVVCLSVVNPLEVLHKHVEHVFTREILQTVGKRRSIKNRAIQFLNLT